MLKIINNVWVYSLGELPPGAIVVAAHPEQEVVQKHPEAVILPEVVVAADQPLQEILETGNTTKLT